MTAELRVRAVELNGSHWETGASWMPGTWEGTSGVGWKGRDGEDGGHLEEQGAPGGEGWVGTKVQGVQKPMETVYRT